jgi:hypothetical protein
MARLNRDPELPATIPAQWQHLLRAMTAREPANRITAVQAADALRQLAVGEDVERTVAISTPVVAAPDATSVLPATAVVSQQVPAYEGPAVPVASPRRRANAVLIAALLLVVVAAVAIGVALARQHNGTSSTVQPGHPTLHQPLEDDVYQLEKLVHR